MSSLSQSTLLRRSGDSPDEGAAAPSRGMREMDEFCLFLAHELRAPLRAQEQMAKLLLETQGPKLDRQGLHVVDRMRSSAAKMAVLIDELTEFSRLAHEPLRAVKIDMSELLRDVIDEFRALKTPRFPQFMVEALPRAWGSRAMLRRVWFNLIANAIKFSGGRDFPIIHVGAMAQGAENTYSVTDNGVGFDMAYKARLFGIFQRLHSEREFPGSGAGLALVKCIVTRHGGRVQARGGLGDGAVFQFTLPSVESAGHHAGY